MNSSKVCYFIIDVLVIAAATVLCYIIIYPILWWQSFLVVIIMYHVGLWSAKLEKRYDLPTDRTPYEMTLLDRIEVLQAALRPFAESQFDTDTYPDVVVGHITVGDVKAARAAFRRDGGALEAPDELK